MKNLLQIKNNQLSKLLLFASVIYNGHLCAFTTQASPYAPTSAPSNDEPCSSIPVAVSSSTNCTALTGGTVSGATASSFSGSGSCGLGFVAYDVWFSFVANSTSQVINLINMAGNTNNIRFSVHPGTCGSVGVAVFCSTWNIGAAVGLNVGHTYYIRVYERANAPPTNTFSLCITPACNTIPTNDNCSGAIPVTVNSGTTCSSQIYGTICGSTASGVSLGVCDGTAIDDVWFSFVATYTAHVVELSNGGMATLHLNFSVQPGSCGLLGAALLCKASSTGGKVYGNVYPLTVGDTYYVRVYSAPNLFASSLNFNVCVTTPPLSASTSPLNIPCGNAANNDFCSNPATLTAGIGSFSSSTSSLYSPDISSNLGSAFCGHSIENNSCILL